MTLSASKVKVEWPVDMEKSKTVDVQVPMATNDKKIKNNTEVRMLNITINKKRKTHMAVCVADI